ncbi:MAG: bifunctional phosphoribosylaminoimidazolecarboxamide formyltransferase/IMP cyclohydrolase [Actinomycetota bacterium]|nr:bifunctional phosphoribosylaminoimidazolecarboxamide formyltransferase/IMP cyclohydrolase [Actinomycetota bacterium]
MRALVSVYDKAGLVELARGLSELGWELVASGNTGRALEEAGIAHLEVAKVTGSPEMLGGRVKTLHPRIHGGILADRSVPEHLADLDAQGIAPIDLVVCNLYPFTASPSIEMIDIGGPALVRAAAKNHAHVGVVTSPDDYAGVLAELQATGELSFDTRRHLARRAFAHTAAYDAAIVSWLDGDDPLPPTLHLTLERAEVCRYGENPHQHGARYRSGPGWWDGVVQHAGTALSYLNIFDADAAWRLVHELAEDAGSGTAAVVVKHANPCGAAVADDLTAAYTRALEGDPVAAFGGIVALRGEVTDEVAEAVAAGPQADVIVAGAFTSGALERLVARRKATRLLSAPAPEETGRQVRTLGAAALVQDGDVFTRSPRRWQVATERQPSRSEWADLVLAWRLCGRTTSNAVVVVSGRQAVGVGAGQQSRVAAATLAVEKAGRRAAGGAGASDGFFPFPDGLEVLARAGVSAVVQPGGSVRDGEVVAAADAAGIAMVLTGERHFRH